LLTRNLPGQVYLYAASQIAPSTALNSIPYEYTVLADNQSFTYSPDGQVTFAGNRDATVTRNYHPNGRLLSENLAIKTGPRTGADHQYATGYRYDLNNRRARLAAPAQFTGDSVGYAYDPAWGALTSVTDIAGNQFSFAYNNRGEMTGVTYPGNYSQTLGYDQDGQLSSDAIANSGSQAFPFLPLPQLRNFAVTSRDARGLIRASTEPILSDRVNASYDGLGALLTANLRQNLTTTQSQAAFYATNDTMTVDALGNLSATVKRDSIRLLDNSAVATTYATASYTYAQIGRVTTYNDAVSGTTAYIYNGAGSQVSQATTQAAGITDRKSVV
jgi:YD repeat-containing protein